MSFVSPPNDVALESRLLELFQKCSSCLCYGWMESFSCQGPFQLLGSSCNITVALSSSYQRGGPGSTGTIEAKTQSLLPASIHVK